MDIDGAQYDTGTHKDFGVARENALAAVQCRGENATKKKRRRIDSETKDQAAEFCTRLVDSDKSAVILFCASLEMPCCSAKLTSGVLVSIQTFQVWKKAQSAFIYSEPSGYYTKYTVAVLRIILR